LSEAASRHGGFGSAAAQARQWSDEEDGRDGDGGGEYGVVSSTGGVVVVESV
jgi:hypothetical protein